MPDLRIQIAEAKVVPFAAVPTIAFQLHIHNSLANEEIHTIALRSQIQIETTRRGYTPEEQARLLDLCWQSGAMGTDTAQPSVDAHQHCGAALRGFRYDGSTCTFPVHSIST